jgi:hypothetical protein
MNTHAHPTLMSTSEGLSRLDLEIHSTLMSTFERLSRLDLKIHKIGHQERLTIDGDVTSH